MSFCEILKDLLEDSGITQKKLAADLNIGVTTIGNYVRGYREPDFEIFKMLAKYFDVSTDYLLDYQHDITSDHSEDELLRIYRLLSKDQRELFIEQGKLLLSHSKKTHNNP